MRETSGRYLWDVAQTDLRDFRVGPVGDKVESGWSLRTTFRDVLSTAVR